MEGGLLYRLQSIGVNGGLSSYPPPPPPPAPARPVGRNTPPPPLTHTQSPPYRYRGPKKNAASGEIEPPSVFYPDIRTYLISRYVRYGMFPADLKSSFPHSQKRKEVNRTPTGQTDGQTDRRRTDRRKGPRTLNILRYKRRIRKNKWRVDSYIVNSQSP